MQEGPSSLPALSDDPPFVAGLVSVILPVYNHAQFAIAAIQSVFDQTYRPIELIVIDDGSSDDSVKTMKDFFEARPPSDGINVRFSARENRGAAETINEGILASRGEYVAILNSDDLYDPTRLQECIDLLKHEGSRLVFTYVRPIDESGIELAYDHSWRQWYYNALLLEMDFTPSISFLLLSTNIAVSTGNLVFCRNVFAEIGPFASYRYVHDLDFLLRFSLIEEPSILRKALYSYRIHANNTISENHDRTVEEVVSATRQFLASCLSGAYRNPMVPSFSNWPASLNDIITTYPPLRSALDGLLDAPLSSQPSAKLDPPRLLASADARGSNVVVLSHDLSRTGAPMLVLEVARSLVRLGNSVRVISMKDGPIRADFTANSIPTRTLDDDWFARRLIMVGTMIAGLRRVLGRTRAASAPRFSPLRISLAAAQRMANFFTWLGTVIASSRLATGRHDTLIINSFASFPLAFRLLSRWRGRVFWYVHETLDPQLMLRSGRARKRLDTFYREKRFKFLFGSEATRAMWAQHGFDGDVRYWSGISRSTHNRRDAAPPLETARRFILTVGSSGTRKGTGWLIEAFACARSRGWIPEDVQLIIVGCPPPSELSQARDFLVRIWKKDLRGSVRLIGNISPDLLSQYYRTADLYVQTSIMECLPLTLLTAMAHGLPIVTTDVDGCKEAIEHGNSGLLVPARRIEPLAHAMADLLKDKDQAQRLGDGARQRFERMFSLEATLEPLVTTILGVTSTSCAFDRS